jgi:hypothetical protein
MLRLILILTVVSLIVVPLLLGLAAVWTFFGVMLAGNGIMGVPEWPMAVYVVFALGLEWLCVSVVNGCIARKWFPHVRGSPLLAAVIPVRLVLTAAALGYATYAPLWKSHGATASAGVWHGNGCELLAFRTALAGVALVWQVGSGHHGRASMFGTLIALLVFAATVLTVASVGLTAVMLTLVWALPSRKWRHRDAAIRLAAVQGHRNRAVLRWVAAHDKDPAVCHAAQERLAAL